jgi:cytoskeletal protein CcmA (bactofilin family)
MSRPGSTVPVNASVLAADLEIVGDIDTRGRLFIEGRVRGNLIAAQIVVTATGIVTGDIAACDVTVDGVIAGHVSAHSLDILSTGQVTGAVMATNLSIDPGGLLEGHAAVPCHSTLATPRVPTVAQAAQGTFIGRQGPRR